MKKSLAAKLLIALIILIVIDIVDASIKSNLSPTIFLSSMIMRGSTLLTAWIVIKAIK